MANSWFQFKQFTVYQDHCAMKVTTDACLFGAWTAGQLRNVNPQKILDIGTGTGLLSLMMAQQCKAKIDAIDIDTAAAQQAKTNIDASPWKERLAVMQGDARKILQSAGQYDVIVSNPPFYENELQSGNQQKNTAHHSTELSLDDLVDIIDSDILISSGSFYLLLPYKRNSEIEKIFSKKDLGITHKVLVRQSTGHNFFRIMLSGRRGKSNEPAIVHEMAIKDERGQYTPAFTGLLKDYYLYL